MVLLAHYLFDEGPEDYPTTAIDIAGGGFGPHNGSYSLNKSTNGNFISPGGYNGSHLKTGNTNGFGITSLINDFDMFLQGAMSVAFWCRFESTSGIYVANFEGFGGTSNDNEQWSIEFIAGNELRFGWEIGIKFPVDVDSSGSICPDDGAWHHYTLVRKLLGAGPNYEVLYYVDGSLAYTNDNSGAGYAGPTSGAFSYTSIGHSPASKSNTAHIDSLRIYDNAISAGDVSTIYAAELPEITMDSDTDLIVHYDDDVIVSSILPYEVTGMAYHSDNLNVGYVTEDSDPHHRAYSYWPMRDYQHFPTIYQASDITSNLKHQQLGNGAGGNLPTKISGQHGYYFDGSTSYMTGDTEPAFNANESITIEADFRVDNIVSYSTFIGRSTSANNTNFTLRIYNGYVQFYFRNAANTTNRSWSSSAVVVSTTTRHHIVFKHTWGDSTSTKCFIDGVEISGAWAGDGNEQPLYNITWPVNVGCRNTGSSIQFMTGYVYSAAIWKEYLSDDDIVTLYNKAVADRAVV
jgi:hypothetical protein